ncbi:hypothetical protein Axi01nite_31320 [Actinoplanes xinjiangensis]|nr:hypothetical protein Axi01nite_31320 [Actinoplanes xinjiangensis]
MTSTTPVIVPNHSCGPPSISALYETPRADHAPTRSGAARRRRHPYPGRMRPVLRLLGLRLLYFLLVFGVLTVAPLGLDLVLRVGIAFLVSMVLSFFLLRRERLEVTERVVTSVDARRERRRQSDAG